ncbi:MAG: acetylxylan esterase [bacterium]
MRKSLIALMVFLCAAGAAAAGEFEMDPEDYSFRANVETREQFEDWKKKVVMFYRKTMRIRPEYEALPLEEKYIESIRIGERVTRHRIEYGTTDGLRIPAYLFVPDTGGKAPAVIVYHGHGAGKVDAAEGEGTNENALARYLAEKCGYVVLAPDARSFGEFQIPRRASHVDYYLGLIFSGKLYTAKLMEDGYQDMALLRTVAAADMERVGAAGISMGSWRTLNHAALHEEVDAAVVSGLYIPWEYLFSERHCRCQHIPKLAEKMNMEDLAATIFPRRLMIQWGLDDEYHGQGAEELIGRTEEIAEFMGWGESFTVDRHEGMGHRFSNEEIGEFFKKHLGSGAW